MDNHLSDDIEFLQLLKANQLKTPNEFTIRMGQLIRKAREERGMSQAELAKETNRRPATISDIENGKSEIGVLTLVLFAIILNKPISYFFPESLLKNLVSDVKTPFQHEILEMATEIEYIGGSELTVRVFKVLKDYFEDQFDEAVG